LNSYFNIESYKQKNKYLLIGGVIFAVIIYMLAIRPTIDAYQQKKVLEQKLVQAKSAPQRMAGLETRLAFINSKVSSYLIDSTRNQEDILHAVSTFCQKNNLTLNEFPVTTYEEQTDFTIETNVVVAEGSFSNLVRLVYELEHKNKVGKVNSVKFISSMDTKRKKNVLNLIIYLQNIRIKNKADENS
jgi:hypothetical protein